MAAFFLENKALILYNVTSAEEKQAAAKQPAIYRMGILEDEI